jgi:lysozyme family protein
VIKLDKIFLEEAEKIKEIEGDYVDHPSDPGGKTRWGISEWLARAYNYEGKMSELSWEKAKEIYYREYWLKNKYYNIKNKKIAGEVFEQAINLPYIKYNKRYILKANYHLQKTYNLVSDKNIIVDGLIGNQTLSAINDFNKINHLYNILNGLQAKHYLEIVEDNPKLKDFIVGWFAQRIKIN